MHSKIFSATPIGVSAHLVEVEVDLSFGMLEFHIVGLPDTAIKESRRRITSALKNSGLRLPERKITVNLAPANVRKEGTLFDLPIAIGMLTAGSVVSLSPTFLQETLFIGELSLDGTIRPIKGALPITYDAQALQKKRIILPKENAQEAACIKNIEVFGVTHLVELVNFLRGESVLAPTTFNDPAIQTDNDTTLDFMHVKGQQQAKRALQIVAAGRHNIMLIGPPGAGKTMLATRLATIMPPMTFDEMVETSKVYSISGKLNSCNLIKKRPFRAPHHTISQAGLVGGGSFPQPGDISLAHQGILFLDELTEFKRTTLELLRQPLETQTVSIARAQHAVTFPASFLLVAALNPCPCGFFGDKRRTCLCSTETIRRYFGKISGPLLDRIDLHVNVQSMSYDTLTISDQKNKGSRELYEGVKKAVARQQDRFQKTKTSVRHNSTMTPDLVETYCVLTPSAQDVIKKAFDKLGLSMRSYHKILKIARTIADLEEQEIIDIHHIQEALMYRVLDRQQP